MSLRIARKLRGPRLNTVRPGFGRSIALRMTAWYTGSAFLLIFLTTGVLYWGLAADLEKEDVRTLRNTAAEIQLLLPRSPNPELAHTLSVASKRTLHHPQEIFVRILGANGRPLVHSPGMDEQLPPATFPSASLVPGSRDTIGEVTSRSGRLFLVLSRRVDTDAGATGAKFLQIALDRTDDMLLLHHYRERLWLVLTASLVLCAGVGYIIARSGMHPIERITATARRVRSSTLDQRIQVGGLPDELRSLAATFNEMLDRLEASFAQLSQFSADVAHELRTPINNLVGEIEVAVSKERSAEEYREVLESAFGECTRISRIINSLLFLARAETTSTAPHHEPIEIEREIAAVCDFYEAAAADAGVNLEFVLGQKIYAPFDRNLFQQAIGNLVGNALTHTPRGGHIEVNAAVVDDTLRVVVEDSGCGIGPEHLPFVFDRFYRVDKARSSASGNVGLGLAVVRSIIRLHGGTVDIESTIGQGTRVVLKAPTAYSSGVTSDMT